MTQGMPGSCPRRPPIPRTNQPAAAISRSKLAGVAAGEIRAVSGGSRVGGIDYGRTRSQAHGPQLYGDRIIPTARTFFNQPTTIKSRAMDTHVNRCHRAD
jgi:hypothetical protein